MWRGAHAMIGVGSSIATTRTNADSATGTSCLTGERPGSRACTHLCNWLAFTPALRARPDSEAPGRRQASASRRLSTVSKLRSPPTPTRATRKGKKLRSSSVIDCVRKVRLRTQS